jgi:hypothetical protein
VPATLSRRRILGSAGALALFAPFAPVAAQGASSLTRRDAASGVRAALERGAQVAVDTLGRNDGFWGNELVRIALPEWLQRAESGLKLLGRGREVDALKLGMNRAAEQAVPQARTLLMDAVKSMSLTDAKAIVTGGNDAVTRFFADKTRAPLTQRFVPIVTRVTEANGLARQYNQLAGEGEKMGLVKPEQARIERYVSAKALDGLYLMIGEEERKIRADPAAAGSDILKNVFGGLR